MKFRDACLKAASEMVSYPDKRALEQLADVTTAGLRMRGKRNLSFRAREALNECLDKKGE